MGRRYWRKKEEADGLKKIPIRLLKKHGFLDSAQIQFTSGTIKWTRGISVGESTVSIQTAVNGDEEYLRIYYNRIDDEGREKDFDYKIPLTTTPCHFGGKRYWFTCPWYTNGAYCGRRVGVLYLGGDLFACRHCYKLTYNSRNLSGFSKIAGKAISADELDELGGKVKRRFYAGKMTRKYRSYVKKGNKTLFQLRLIAHALGEDIS